MEYRSLCMDCMAVVIHGIVSEMEIFSAFPSQHAFTDGVLHKLVCMRGRDPFRYLYN